MTTLEAFPTVDEPKPTLHQGGRVEAASRFVPPTPRFPVREVDLLRTHMNLRPRRFVTADRSMEPTLVDGQGLVAVASRRARVGQLRCFEHPLRPGFWLVKRVTAVDRDQMIVESDNRSIATEDSNRFGPVPVAGSYRVVIRVPRSWM